VGALPKTPYFAEINRYSMRKILAFALLGALLSGCVSNKKLTYLQRDESSTEELYEIQRTKYLVQPNDILSIRIRSLDPSTQLFTASQTGNLNGGDLVFYLNGYTIDSEGNVELPILGKVYVEGMTIEDAELAIREGLGEYFKEIFVSVQLSGIRFSIVGDVGRPGKYTIYQNQATIFEAIALAGDGRITANRQEVEIIRQYPEGSRIFTVDLTSSEVLRSETYLIQPNDIINVKPLHVKSYGIGTTGFQTIALSLSTIANILLIITTVNNL